jgi:hypothetical protein
MSDYSISHLPDEDQVEITDLDSQDGSSSASLSIVLLKLSRKVPRFENTRARYTMLAWLACVIILLFLVQPGVANVPRQTPVTSARDLQYPLAVYSAISTHNVTWFRMSNGKIIVIPAGAGRVMWHHCKVQRWFTPPKYAHPTVVVCT